MTKQEIELGRMVRQVWLDYCKQSKLPESHSHSAPWEELSLWEKNVDVNIGVALYEAGRTAGYEQAQRAQMERDCVLICPDCQMGHKAEQNLSVYVHRYGPHWNTIICGGTAIRWAFEHRAAPPAPALTANSGEGGKE